VKLPSPVVWALLLAALGAACRGRQPARAPQAAQQRESAAPPVQSSPGTDSSHFTRPSSATDSLHLLFVGVYDPGPLYAVTGQVWYGLFQTPAGWEVALVRVTVDSTQTPCAPGERQREYSPRVSIDRPEQPLLMVRGVSGLTAGPVRTIVRGEHQLYPGQDAGPFTSSHDVRTLIAYGEAPFFASRLNVIDRPAVRDYVLAMWSRERDTSQVIFGPASIFWPPTLAWVGDLDGDGEADFVLRPSIGQEEPVAPELWLSSTAASGELVHRVTGRRTIYCD
jgi:hypothetical protein